MIETKNMGLLFLASEEVRAFCSWGRNLQGQAFHTFVFLLEIGIKLQNHRDMETDWKPLMKVTKNKPARQEGEKLKERRYTSAEFQIRVWSGSVGESRVILRTPHPVRQWKKFGKRFFFSSYDMGVITFDGGKRFLKYFCLPSIHCLLQIILSFPSLHFYQGLFFLF